MGKICSQCFHDDKQERHFKGWYKNEGSLLVHQPDKCYHLGGGAMLTMLTPIDKTKIHDGYPRYVAQVSYTQLYIIIYNALVDDQNLNSGNSFEL